MRVAFALFSRALAILVFWAAVGAGANLVSSTGIPWVYEPPKEIIVSGVKIPLIDETRAAELMKNQAPVFIDARKEEDYRSGTVKSALLLPPELMEERFPLVQPLLSEDGLIVLFCYGPECDAAERVAELLIQLGYKNLAIMSPGFTAWEEAGHPVEGQR